MCVGNRPWGGMSHGAIIKAVVEEHRSLQFGDETPDGIRLLAQAAMSHDRECRPTFEECLEVLSPIEAELQAAGWC